MFRNRRTSQKPNQELINKFQKTFGDIVPSTATRDAASMEQKEQHEQQEPNDDPTRRNPSGEMPLNNDMTPKPMDGLRFTPFLDPNAQLPYLSSNQANGYYTPNSGELGTAFHGQLGDLQPPGAGLSMMTPLSLPHQLMMNADGSAMDFNGFDQQYLPQQYAANPNPNPFTQQTAFEPSAFVNRDAGYSVMMNDPMQQAGMKGLDMQDNPAWGVEQTAVLDEPKFRYNATLRAPTAMVKHPHEIPITYLNKGQAYTVSVVDSHNPAPLPTQLKYRTHIRVSFEEEEQRSKPAACWQLWKEGRGVNEAHRRSGRLQAVEYVDPMHGVGGSDADKDRQIQLENASFDGFSVVWTPNSSNGAADCAIPVRFNFLSTDFSHSKGVKGIPVRLCAKTEVISPADAEGVTNSSSPEVCYCKVKLFRDHGAERKLSNDVAHVKKGIEKLKQQMAQAEAGGGFGKRKRNSASFAFKAPDDRPTKIVKPPRRWSLDSQMDGPGQASLSDDLSAKLAMMQEMFTSTKSVSALNLRGEETDDPALHPVHLPGEGAKPETNTGSGGGELFQDTTSATSTFSPESSAVSLPLNSPHQAIRTQLPRFGCDSGSYGSVDGLLEQSRPCSEGALDKLLPRHVPARVSRVGDRQGGGAGFIDAVDIDPTYRPPTTELPKPVACLYVRFPQTDSSFYRAVYLTDRTLANLADKIAQKQRLNPERIVRVVHVTQGGLRIMVDDDLVRELGDGQDMVAEIVEVSTGDGDGGIDVPSSGFEVTLSF